LSTIGVKFDKKLYHSIFWLYDLNGDGLVDDKEFWLINSLFRGRSILDKVKSKFIFYLDFLELFNFWIILGFNNLLSVHECL